MKLEKHINSLVGDNQLQKLNHLLTRATATLSGGRRVITVQGYEGSISFDHVINKTLRIGQQRFNEDKLTAHDRVAGIEITRKLATFYRVIDGQIEQANQQIKQANCIIRFLNRLRKLSRYNNDGLRWIVEGNRFPSDMLEFFLTYKREQFLREYGKKNMFGQWINPYHSPHAKGVDAQGDILVNEESIRAKTAPSYTLRERIHHGFVNTVDSYKKSIRAKAKAKVNSYKTMARTVAEVQVNAYRATANIAKAKVNFYKEGIRAIAIAQLVWLKNVVNSR